MKLLRRLPRSSSFIPGKAQDLAGPCVPAPCNTGWAGRTTNSRTDGPLLRREVRQRPRLSRVARLPRRSTTPRSGSTTPTFRVTASSPGPPDLPQPKKPGRHRRPADDAQLRSRLRYPAHLRQASSARIAEADKPRRESRPSPAVPRQRRARPSISQRVRPYLRAGVCDQASASSAAPVRLQRQRGGGRGSERTSDVPYIARSRAGISRRWAMGLLRRLAFGPVETTMLPLPCPQIDGATNPTVFWRPPTGRRAATAVPTTARACPTPKAIGATVRTESTAWWEKTRRLSPAGAASPMPTRRFGSFPVRGSPAQRRAVRNGGDYLSVFERPSTTRADPHEGRHGYDGRGAKAPSTTCRHAVLKGHAKAIRARRAMSSAHVDADTMVSVAHHPTPQAIEAVWGPAPGTNPVRRARRSSWLGQQSQCLRGRAAGPSVRGRPELRPAVRARLRPRPRLHHLLPSGCATPGNPMSAACISACMARWNHAGKAGGPGSRATGPTG